MTSVPTFDDDFNSLSLWNGTSGVWDTAAPYVPLNGNGYSLPTNGEQEWYINANYAPTATIRPWTISDGILALSAALAAPSIQPLIDGYQYTSGAINTSQSFSQTYGYFEMRAELPAGQGYWPAFWLLPENGSWPPEIDVIEMLGNNPSVYYTSIHSGTASAEVNAGQGNTVLDTSAGFHTYGVDWEPEFITFYFDGSPVYQTPTPADMNTPMYMIANLAVGGSWPGDVDASTPFPGQMQIDYIRAYATLPTDILAQEVTASGSVTTSAANYVVPTNVTKVVLDSSGPQTVTGNNLGDTITSNDAGSTIIGGSGNDRLITGHGADKLTGGAGHDTFVFNIMPWNAGHITDFTPGTDWLDLSGIFTSIGYTGSNPIAGGYLSFVSDGAGDTQVFVNTHTAGNPWPTLITTLDHVAPASITTHDWMFQAGLPQGTVLSPISKTSGGDTAPPSKAVPAASSGGPDHASDGASVPHAPSAANPWATLEQIVTHQSGGWLFHST